MLTLKNTQPHGRAKPSVEDREAYRGICLNRILKGNTNIRFDGVATERSGWISEAFQFAPGSIKHPEVGAQVHLPSRGRRGSFLSTLVDRSTNCIIVAWYMASMLLKLGRSLGAQTQWPVAQRKTSAGIGRGEVSHDLLIKRSELLLAQRRGNGLEDRWDWKEMEKLSQHRCRGLFHTVTYLDSYCNVATWRSLAPSALGIDPFGAG